MRASNLDAALRRGEAYRKAGADAPVSAEWPQLEKEMLGVIGLEKLLDVERATVEMGGRPLARGPRRLDHLEGDAVGIDEIDGPATLIRAHRRTDRLRLEPYPGGGQGTIGRP